MAKLPLFEKFDNDIDLQGAVVSFIFLFFTTLAFGTLVMHRDVRSEILRSFVLSLVIAVGFYLFDRWRRKRKK